MKRLHRTLVCIASLVLATGTASAFPDKTVKIVVPFGPGTVTDMLAREIAQSLAPIVRQAVIVDNRAGAEGSIGAQAVLAEPDGHTLMFTSSSLPVLDPLLKKGLAYDPIKDFVPLCTAGRIGNVMNLSGMSPYKSYTEFMSAARTAAPGKFTFAYSSATTRLAGELFQQASGVTLTSVPYRATVTGLTDVAGGQVDLFFIDPVSAAPHYATGRLRPLVVAGARRVRNLPDVPSAAEVGLPAYEMQPWFGLYLPAKASPTAVERMRVALAQALKAPALVALMERSGLEEFTLCGEAMQRHQAADAERMAQVIRRAGIQPQ